MTQPTSISVVGLGYVGLPLAIALARHHEVVGYDLSSERIDELSAGTDRTREVTSEELRSSRLVLTNDPGRLAGSQLFVITVPTPVDEKNEPDLSAVREACRIVGGQLRGGEIVVLESTVWPGVTEEICGPELEAASGLKCGTGFGLGYSPERINPGDRQHGVDKITKVVAGQTPEITAKLKEIYGAITEGNVFAATDIKTAEAAKVIENAQRDINIAFINEVSMIFHKLGLSTRDVLETAKTKWNFLSFEPGLVGGHCIGVDPFYLAHRAQEVGHQPEIILAGRRINDSMGGFIAEQISDRLEGLNKPRAPVLVLGLTFKENVPDLRNSKVVDLVSGLSARGHEVEIHDPLADPREAAGLYGIELRPSLDGASGYACVVGAVRHSPYCAFTTETFRALLAPGGLVADIKGIWRQTMLPEGMERWEL